MPVDDTEYNLFVDDWMYMMDTNRVMNRSYMKKLGITVAEISIFFDKTEPVRKCGIVNDTFLTCSKRFDLINVSPLMLPTHVRLLNKSGDIFPSNVYRTVKVVKAVLLNNAVSP